MRLNFLELRNYRKFEHARMELPDGIIGIVGNNGAGKSTLVESIAWALFGNQQDIVRAGKESIRRDGAKQTEPTSVRLEFTYAGEEYVVIREMVGKNLTIDASLMVNGKVQATGSNPVSEHIEKKLGMDYKSFFISVFAKQNDLAAFFQLSEGNRRKTVLRMLGIDRLDEIVERMSKAEHTVRERTELTRAVLIDENGRPRKESLFERGRELSGSELSLTKEILQLRKEQESIKEEEKSIGQRASEISERLRLLRDRKSKLDMEQARLAANKKESERINKALRESEEAQASFAGLKDLNVEMGLIKEKHDRLLTLRNNQAGNARLTSDLHSISDEISKLNDEIEEFSKELKKEENLTGMMRQNTERITEIQKDMEALKDSQSEIKERIRSFKENVGQDEQHLKEIESLGPEGICPTCERPLKEHHQMLRDKLSSIIENAKQNLKSLESTSNDDEKELSRHQKEMEALKKKSEALIKKEKRVTTLEGNLRIAVRSRGGLEERRKRIESELTKSGTVRFNQKELDETKGRIEELSNKRDVLMGMASITKKLPELKENAKEIEKELKRLESAIDELEFDSSEIEMLDGIMNEIEGKRAGLRKGHDEVFESILTKTRQKEAVSSEVAVISKEQKSLEEKEKDLKSFEIDLEYATKLRDLVTDFKVQLVSRIIPMLSDIASQLLSQLTDGRYNSLTLDDGYNIYIEDGGEKRILERFSGGEADLANLCLRLAISRVIAERTSTEGINLLVLDEIFGSQDTSRKRNLMMSFNALSNQFRQIFLITHIDDVREYLTSVIDVREDEHGISHARLAE